MRTAISPNNLYVASEAKEYGIVQISYFETMESICRIKLGVGRATHVSFFPDNQHVLVRTHDSWYQDQDILKTYNVFDGSFVSRCIFDADDPIISRDGQSIFFSFGVGSSLAQWYWQTSKIPDILFDGRVFKKEEYFVRALSDDNTKLIVNKYPAIRMDWPQVREYSRSPHLEMWDIPSKSVIQSIPGFQNASLLPDGKLMIATSAEDGMLKAIEIESGQIKFELSPPSKIPNAPWKGHLLVSPNGQYLIAHTQSDKNVGVWSIQDRNLLYELPWEIFSVYQELTVTPDSRYVIQHPGNKRWNLETSQEVFCD